MYTVNHHFIHAYGMIQKSQVKNGVNLSKTIFSSFNFFMHTFTMSVTYLQSIKRIH